MLLILMAQEAVSGIDLTKAVNQNRVEEKPMSFALEADALAFLIGGFSFMGEFGVSKDYNVAVNLLLRGEKQDTESFSGAAVFLGLGARKYFGKKVYCGPFVSLEAGRMGMDIYFKSYGISASASGGFFSLDGGYLFSKKVGSVFLRLYGLARYYIVGYTVYSENIYLSGTKSSGSALGIELGAGVGF